MAVVWAERVDEFVARLVDAIGNEPVEDDELGAYLGEQEEGQ